MPYNKGRQIDPERLLPSFVTGKKIYTREEARKELEELKKDLGVE